MWAGPQKILLKLFSMEVKEKKRKEKKKKKNKEANDVTSLQIKMIN
jgi:hypothetical protein